MPKILENLKETIINEARKQLFEKGYAGMTIRSVAEGCNIGTGTLYNYFKSKDILISAIILEDWWKCTGKMKEVKLNDKVTFIKEVGENLAEFTKKYDFLFKDEKVKANYAVTLAERHVQLKKVIANILLPACEGVKGVDSIMLSEHIANTLLTMTSENAEFKDIQCIIEKLVS